MKPRILISRSPESSGLYEAAVERAGGEPLSFHCPDLEMDFDGLILAGGGDMDPEEFQELNLGSVEIDKPRDQAELALVSRCINEGKPLLGICRGHQVVNIALGGTIYQDLKEPFRSAHAQTPEGASVSHPIQTAVYTMLDELYGSQLVVNSSHHQAVFKFGLGMYRTAWDENGIVEAMQHGSLPIWTVQFHPEQMTGEDGGPDGQKIFDYFLEQCRKRCGF
ncbi:MAG: gamma-glutamyl-gamma-aminobutyrate hydrolase family protein [Clostridiales bacterium]|uniref:gamma-glutamyl-gamma-aminobutyrate hydrolase family protein n=1 Tax=Evtepia sp. TaxID=2773933 RepID=UPI0029834E43|nr:gamma-glutamyl-gamma-aminobutyrate hydrolase family protein [Evtepia sp.]MDD7289077.1 gamma-glutamyl-gamma-aminobutyrate hydrolase family protein [Clostridiales bacterium]MDY3992202.1 gamma-glutamyl-gamma-aminobutyrate hydrolase family protein [Evtepia sp.]MDY4429614.1 gamma-glutamyl-gamma-aminobutyrate hydrolase family protein [Evtepia sp.]